MFSRGIEKKALKNFMAPFYGCGSAASKLEPLRGGSLLFTTKFPEISGIHFIDMEGWKADSSLEPSSGFEHGNHLEEAVYFLPLSYQKFQVLILSTSEVWKTESCLEPSSGFEQRTPRLEIQLPIQHLNH